MSDRLGGRLVVADAEKLGRTLTPALRSATAGVAPVAAVVGLRRHLLQRQFEATLARDTDLLVTTGGRPAEGMLLLTGLVVDVVRSLRLALATHPRSRRRGALVAEIAPDGRGEAARTLVIAVDLVAEEWSTHDKELRQRLDALGFTVDAPTYVAAVDGRLATYTDFQLPQDPDGPRRAPTWHEPRPGPAGLLAFDLP